MVIIALALVNVVYGDRKILYTNPWNVVNNSKLCSLDFDAARRTHINFEFRHPG